MLPKPGKEDYTSPASYRPIALLNTLSKAHEKMLTRVLSHQVEKDRILHRGHCGGRPNRSGQEATVHLVSWVKNQWAKGRVVGALFANVNSAFPLVHHPKLLDTLAKKVINREILNLIHDSLSNRETSLTFNGYESEALNLTHGLPQGSLLSPLFYLLYNTTPLEIADRTEHAEALGFIDDVILLTSSNDTHRLKAQMQTLSFRKIQWAKHHGEIFDTGKTNWVLFSPTDSPIKTTIDFGERKRLRPIKQVKWLGITFDNKLTFKQHWLNVLAKGAQQAGFLPSLSNSRWGIPPHSMKTLLTTTIHAAIDYGVAAWMPLNPPKYFTDKLSTIDHTCAQAALGALKFTPSIFLDRDFDLVAPKVKLQSKILQYIAKALTKPPHHPDNGFGAQARSSNPRSHHTPHHRFFQHDLCRQFNEYVAQTTLDPTVQL